MEIEQRNNKEDTKREEVMETQKVYISYYHLQEWIQIVGNNPIFKFERWLGTEHKRVSLGSLICVIHVKLHLVKVLNIHKQRRTQTTHHYKWNELVNEQYEDTKTSACNDEVTTWS